MKTKKSNSKKALWTGRVISAVCVLFLLMDSIMKIVKAPATIQGSGELGWPVDSIQVLGIVLLACTILYIIPRTALLGALLLTGYLGGAVAIMVRAEMPGHPFFFPVIFAILVWAGLLLQDRKLQALIGFRKEGADVVANSGTNVHLAH